MIETKTREKNQYFSVEDILDTLREAALVLDADYTVVAVNAAFLRLFKVSGDETIGRCIYDLGSGQWNLDGLKHLLANVIPTNRAFQDFKVSDSFPSLGRKTMLINGRKIGERPLIFLSIEDVTALSESAQQVRYLSYHDRITGLYTRVYFEEELHRLDTERELPLSIIMGDINNLRLTNDLYGHAEGDKLLRKVADILQAYCRREDVIARWGGDEYVILLPRTDRKTAEKIADRIQNACVGTRETVIPCSVTLGVATKEVPADDIDAVVQLADERMSMNKLVQGERNRQRVISSLLEKVGTLDHDTQEHTRRMQEMALELGKAIHLSHRQLEDLALFAALHDIGKAGIPPEILEKPGRLNEKEWARMQQHPELGARIIRSFPELAKVAEAIRHHHEHWDGTGYPDRIKGDQVPLLVRILSIIDAYDVMTHARTYKRSFSREEAIEELQRNAGCHFDPDLVRIFIQTIDGE